MRRRHALALTAAGLLSPTRGLAQAGPAAVLDAFAAANDQLHSVVVRQGGAEAFARSYRGPGLDRVANVKSVSKTLLSLMTGQAIERGHVSGPDARLLPLLGRPPADDARDEITLGHLLSLRGGLASTSGPGYGAWVSSPDWVAAALARPLEGRPGGRFVYSTGSTHLLGVAVARAADATLLEMARGWLGAPLGIDFAPWVADPQGNYLGGNDMALSPRALARIGQMVLDGGRWEGAQVVPEAWLETSWEPRARSPWSGDAYGYGWFLTRLAGRRAAYGRGYGGQVLAVVPDLGLTMAITSDPMRPARSQGYFGALRRLMDEVARAYA
jgi:CubicO group peptidase (beta-lactamase class C family)